MGNLILLHCVGQGHILVCNDVYITHRFTLVWWLSKFHYNIGGVSKSLLHI